MHVLDGVFPAIITTVLRLLFLSGTVCFFDLGKHPGPDALFA